MILRQTGDFLRKEKGAPNPGTARTEAIGRKNYHGTYEEIVIKCLKETWNCLM
jgi:hypothetical protein